jgi:mRNA interferase MazF
MRRGELYWVDWSPGRGSEQTGRRPALVVQRDAANRNENYPNTVIVTVSTKGKPIPFHVEIPPTEETGLRETSWAKCEQLLTISKERVEQRIGAVNAETLERIEIALKKVLGLD